MEAGEEFEARLKAYEGQSAAVARTGRDPVNAPMIRHWCEAMGDTNPAYLGPDAIAPPTMLQAWTMAGLSGHTTRTHAYDELLGLLDQAGYTSVVATDCEQEYLRPLRPGDEITFDSMIESVSERKTTKLGTGYFVTTRMDIHVGPDLAGTHRFRILKYAPIRRAGQPDRQQRPSEQGADGQRQKPSGQKPSREDARNRLQKPSGEDAGSRPQKPSGEDAGGRPQKPARPLPVVNRDNAGFWEGVRRRRLLIQRCSGCGTLRHPWLPGCNACGGLDWDTVEAGGEGTVYSYVVMHHPPFPAFDPPYVVGLVELAEGVRMIGNVVGVPYDKVRIGLPVRLEFQEYEEGLVLPVWCAEEGTAQEGTAQEGTYERR
ncbi:MAG: hypothetical protein HOZ81_37915 [Streptomyces sp.]|nr:hypothetical protein [Streptomyces sp.]